MSSEPANHPAAEIWPPARVRVRTPRLELRVPTDEDIVALAGAAAGGVHDAGTMPFSQPWSDEPQEVLAASMYRWHARCRGSWSPDRWSLLFAAYVNGEPVGAQDIGARDFGVLREVGSGSWLAQSHQGRGLGSEMRRAMLHFAFAGLGALAANSGAYVDNDASNNVSVACGYEPNGVAAVVRRRGALAPGGVSAERALEHRYRIERAAWEARRRDDIELLGLDDDVLASFGVTGGD